VSPYPKKYPALLPATQDVFALIFQRYLGRRLALRNDTVNSILQFPALHRASIQYTFTKHLQTRQQGGSLMLFCLEPGRVIERCCKDAKGELGLDHEELKILYLSR
jgi:hypothetical protein